MSTSTETKFAFTITGPSVYGYKDADVTLDFWGDESPYPVTQAELTDMVASDSGNTPVVWEDSPYGGQFGTFTSRDPDGEPVGPFSITLEDIIMEPTKYNFTVTGPSRSFGTWHSDVDVTEDFWGDFVPEPMTLAEISDLVGLESENGPVVWGESTYGRQVGTFTSPADPDDDEVGTYSITLEEATA